MTLPSDYVQRSASFPAREGFNKTAVLSRVSSLPPHKQEKEIKRIISEGGTAAEFMTHILGKDSLPARSVPANKKISAPETR